MRISIGAFLMVLLVFLILQIAGPLSPNSISAGSQAIINSTDTFYESHKLFAWGAVLIILVLSGLVLLLGRTVMRMRRVEEQLRQANLVIETSPAVLFRWKTSPGWPVEFVSENVIQFGYSPEVFTSGEVAYSSIIYPDDLENIVSEVAEYASRSVDRFNLEYRIVTGEGAVRWVEERTVAKRDEEGALVCYLGIVIDITDRKQAEEELLLAKFCIDNAGIGIFHTDEHQIFNANDYACKSLGYTVDELRTMSVSGIDPVITSEKMLEIKRSLEATGSATHQTVHRRKDGTTFPVEITANNVEFQDKQYTFSFVKDITDRKQSRGRIARERGEVQGAGGDLSCGNSPLSGREGPLYQSDSREADRLYDR